MKKPFLQRLRHRLSRMRRHPIPVFVFHQVSDVFEPDTMWECDWTEAEAFKRSILVLTKKYTFISLDQVKDHLTQDRFRFKDYAALTADDGWASLKGILPWLAEQKIPVTLFLNPSCLDGKHWNSRETDKLLTEEEVVRIVGQGAPYITIASHGWTHKNSKTMSLEEFEDSVRMSEEVLERLPGHVPFFAFVSGRHTPAQVACLRSRKLTPVFVDGRSNVNDPMSIHRHCIDGIDIHE